MSLQGQLRPLKCDVVKDDFLVTMDLTSMGLLTRMCGAPQPGPRTKTEVVDELSPGRPREQGLVGGRGRDTKQDHSGNLTWRRTNPPRISSGAFTQVEQLGKPGSGGLHKEGSD